VFGLLKRNLVLARELKLEIVAEASRCDDTLARGGTEAPSSRHLEAVFAAMRPGG
jgi:hypothetical protein